MDNVVSVIVEFFNTLWETLVKYYGIYSGFIHSIFPSELGDLIVILLDLVMIVALIKIVAAYVYD